MEAEAYKELHGLVGICVRVIQVGRRTRRMCRPFMLSEFVEVLDVLYGGEKTKGVLRPVGDSAGSLLFPFGHLTPFEVSPNIPSRRLTICRIVL